jgi:hypothetical protein
MIFLMAARSFAFIASLRSPPYGRESTAVDDTATSDFKRPAEAVAAALGPAGDNGARPLEGRRAAIEGAMDGLFGGGGFGRGASISSSRLKTRTPPPPPPKEPTRGEGTNVEVDLDCGISPSASRAISRTILNRSHSNAVNPTRVRKKLSLSHSADFAKSFKLLIPNFPSFDEAGKISAFASHSCTQQTTVISNQTHTTTNIQGVNRLKGQASA